MEALRDLALAEYENMPQYFKLKIDIVFEDMVSQGLDFSDYFRNYSIPTSGCSDAQRDAYEWRKTCPLYKKKKLDFEEFITLKYIDANAEAVILCKGCSSLITGRPFFVCEGCLFDHSVGRTFNLCCKCYSIRNFKGHEHTSFVAYHHLIYNTELLHARQKDDLESRNNIIDRAMMRFGKDFISFARSITTDNGWENQFRSLLKPDEMNHPGMKELQGEKSAETEEKKISTKAEKEEKKKSTIMNWRTQHRSNVDILGASASSQSTDSWISL